MQPDVNLAAPFEEYGPAKTLLHLFQSGRMPGLAPALAGWMIWHTISSGKPIPDFVIPVPQKFFRSWRIGYHPARLLAQEIARAFNASLICPLKWRTLRPRQSLLTDEERKKLPLSAIVWQKKTALLSGKKILVVDDCMVTGATLSRISTRLREAFPSEIFSAVFCCRLSK